MANSSEIEKTFKLYGDNEGTLYLEFWENVQDVASNIAQAELISQKLNNIFAEHETRTFKLLVDLSHISQSAHYPSPRARMIFAETAGHRQIEKVAVIAPSLLTRAVMNFITKASSNKKSIRFFSDRKPALNWLKHGQIPKDNKISPDD